MKIRNLILLIVAAGILVGWTLRTMRPRPKPSAALIGAPVLPGLPVNRVNKIVLTTASNTLALAKLDGIWTVANRFNYPADFAKVADVLLQLRELKIGQVIVAGAAQLGAFHLVDPAAETTGRVEQAGTRVELRDANEGLLATLLIGKPFMRAAPGGGLQGPLSYGDYPDGQYVQTSDGRVVLVGKNLDRLTDDAKSWLAGDFINVAADDIMGITATGPDSAPIKLTRPQAGEPFKLEGLESQEGSLDSSKVNQMSGALNYLDFDDVADPGLPNKETGLDNPVVFEARTKDGRTYTLRVGNTLTNDTFDRYVKVAAAWQPPAEEKKADAQSETGVDEADAAGSSREKEKETEALNDRLAPWTYILRSYRVEPLLIKRSELVKKPEPPQESEQPATDTSAAAGNPPSAAPSTGVTNRPPDEG